MEPVASDSRLIFKPGRIPPLALENFPQGTKEGGRKSLDLPPAFMEGGSAEVVTTANCSAAGAVLNYKAPETPNGGSVYGQSGFVWIQIGFGTDSNISGEPPPRPKRR